MMVRNPSRKTGWSSTLNIRIGWGSDIVAGLRPAAGSMARRKQYADLQPAEMADGVIIAQLARAYYCEIARRSRSDILEEQSMRGYSEESADRARRVGGIAFVAWASLGPQVPCAQAEERPDQLETVIVTGS